MNDAIDPTALSPSEKLAVLTRTLPGAARGITALVERERGQIKKARDNGWPWADIAIALDLPDKAGAIASAYARHTKGKKETAARRKGQRSSSKTAQNLVPRILNEPPSEAVQNLEGAPAPDQPSDLTDSVF